MSFRQHLCHELKDMLDALLDENQPNWRALILLLFLPVALGVRTATALLAWRADRVRGDHFGSPTRNWPEDAKYSNVCCVCHRTFIGHTRRVVCRECASK